MAEADPIRVERLTKVYRSGLARTSVRALDGLTLRVGAGEVFGLLGPNGAGKTTLLKILLGVVRPTHGRASLFDTPVHLPAARVAIGFLPENHRFPDVFTAAGLLRLYGRMGNVPADVLAKRIPQLLEQTGMARWANSRIRTFSKGMMQRLGLAQALLNDPKIVFLDEPTDGVDPIGRREIRDILVDLKNQGKTVFLNSHLLSEVERVCDRVAILNKGALVYEGGLDGLNETRYAYDLTCGAIPEPLLADLVAEFALAPLPPDPAGFARYHVPDAPVERLNALIDRLRGAGVPLLAIQPQRRSLEDAFIQLLQGQETVGGTAA